MSLDAEIYRADNPNGLTQALKRIAAELDDEQKRELVPFLEHELSELLQAGLPIAFLREQAWFYREMGFEVQEPVTPEPMPELQPETVKIHLANTVLLEMRADVLERVVHFYLSNQPNPQA